MTFLLPSHSPQFSFFTDNAKCVMPVSSISDCQLLQSDLVGLVEWTATWKLPIVSGLDTTYRLTHGFTRYTGKYPRYIPCIPSKAMGHDQPICSLGTMARLLFTQLSKVYLQGIYCAVLAVLTLQLRVLLMYCRQNLSSYGFLGYKRSSSPKLMRY